jgi:Trk K+ transport system NAD-binding subunit
MESPTSNPGISRPILVCGLGRLGQYCVAALKNFGITVYGLEIQERKQWDLPECPRLLDQLFIGDCRQPQVLQQAKIQECRAVLLVANHEQVNIAAAFAARSLNPHIRLVVRSAQDNLNQLLGEFLGNFVALEPTQLPANAFALAALGNNIMGFFALENQWLRIVQSQILVGHPWCQNRPIFELNTASRRILCLEKSAGDSQRKSLIKQPDLFYTWDVEAIIEPGDRVVYLELGRQLEGEFAPQVVATKPTYQSRPKRSLGFWQNGRHFLLQRWHLATQTQKVGLVSVLVMLLLYLIGIFCFRLQYPELTWQESLNVPIVLILGGYGDLFGQLKLDPPTPGWLHFYSLSLTVAGTLFVGILYAMLTERVLSARFQFNYRRPALPKSNHVVLIGLGRVGKQVATLLQSFKQPLVSLTNQEIESGFLPKMPLIQGNFHQSLQRVYLETAKSILVLTDDGVTNLELALMARSKNPSCLQVIRIDDPRFSENVAQLLPESEVLGIYAIAAEAFAAAAFGETILSLLQLENQTVLVTEYQIVTGDSLIGRLLSEVALGYRLVPLLHQRPRESPVLLPPEDGRLQAGDRLVVLATMASLQRVEQAQILRPNWQVRVERALSSEAIFDGGVTLARVSGCELALARRVMEQLPATLEFPLYKPQAQRLIRELSKNRVQAKLVAME